MAAAACARVDQTARCTLPLREGNGHDARHIRLERQRGHAGDGDRGERAARLPFESVTADGKGERGLQHRVGHHARRDGPARGIEACAGGHAARHGQRQRVDVGEAKQESRRGQAGVADRGTNVKHDKQHDLEQQRHFNSAAKLQWILLGRRLRIGAVERSPLECEHDDRDRERQRQVLQQHRHQCRIQQRHDHEDTREQHGAGGNGAGGQAFGRGSMRGAQARERQRDRRRRHQPAKQAGEGVARAVGESLRDEARETDAGEQHHEHPEFARTHAGARAKRTFRQQRQDHRRHHGESRGRKQHRLIEA